MFSNPITTGLIIIGASRFDQGEDLGRAVFANAARAAKRYFGDIDQGFGLPDENILDVFDDMSHASAIKSKIFAFVEEGVRADGRPTFTDLFVYIVTHGVKTNQHPLWLMVRSSTEHPDGNERPDSYIEFRSLMNGIYANALCRVYFIVDACYAADAIEGQQNEEDYSEREIYSDVRRDLMPERGSVLFLSNQRNASGLVTAYDGAGLDMPLFSQILFDVLENGVPGQFPYGLSFQVLKHLCQQRLGDKIAAGISPLATNFDVIDFRQKDGPGLSNAAIFPNNDPTRVNRNAIARQVRRAYKEAFAAERQLARAEHRIARHEVENHLQKEELKQLSKELAQARRDLDKLKQQHDTLQGRLRGQSFALLLLVGMTLLAAPLICFLLWRIDPVSFRAIIDVLLGETG